MPQDASIERHLESLERRLLDPETRRSPAEVSPLLSDDFLEIAANGQVYDKAQIIEVLQNTPTPHTDLSDFKSKLLSPDIALVTFLYTRGATTERPAAKSIRSSIWKNTEGAWKMVFHQGTLCRDQLA